MARPKTKESTYINCKIDNKCYDALTQYCEKTGLSKTVAIEHAIKQQYMEQQVPKLVYQTEKQ